MNNAKTNSKSESRKSGEPAATAMLNARYKLDTFFYAPCKAEEISEPEDDPPARPFTVRFIGRHGDQAPERG
jgi:hypothetical protein